MWRSVWRIQVQARMQGCGKTTIVEVLEAVFKHEGLRPASISIDDFYLRFEDQQALAQVRHPQACCPSQLSVNLMLQPGKQSSQ